MIFYRIEAADGSGPYRMRHDYCSWESCCDTYDCDLREELSDALNDEHMGPSWPTTSADPLLPNTFSTDYIFGFVSLDDLLTWFRDGWAERLLDSGIFDIVECESDYYIIGTSQAMFLR